MTRNQLLLSAALGLLTLTAAPALAQAPSAASASASTTAREAREPKQPAERAEALTKHMTRELALTPDQQTKLAALNTQLTSDLSQVRETGKAQRGAHREKVQSIRTTYDANVKAALTPEQYATYEKLRAERDQKQHARHDARRAAKGVKATPGPGPGPAQQ